MSELKAFDVGFGRYCKDGSPCVVAFAADRSPRVLDNKKVYLKSEADAVLAEKDKVIAEKDVEIRRLKRARWLDRAARANAEWGHWATIWFCDTGAILNINKSSVSQDPYRCTITRNAAEWRNLWAEVERTCRAKADQYK